MATHNDPQRLKKIYDQVTAAYDAKEPIGVERLVSQKLVDALCSAMVPEVFWRIDLRGIVSRFPHFTGPEGIVSDCIERWRGSASSIDKVMGPVAVRAMGPLVVDLRSLVREELHAAGLAPPAIAEAVTMGNDDLRLTLLMDVVMDRAVEVLAAQCLPHDLLGQDIVLTLSHPLDGLARNPGDTLHEDNLCFDKSLSTVCEIFGVARSAFFTTLAQEGVGASVLSRAAKWAEGRVRNAKGRPALQMSDGLGAKLALLTPSELLTTLRNSGAHACPTLLIKARVGDLLTLRPREAIAAAIGGNVMAGLHCADTGEGHMLKIKPVDGAVAVLPALDAAWVNLRYEGNAPSPAWGVMETYGVAPQHFELSRVMPVSAYASYRAMLEKANALANADAHDDPIPEECGDRSAMAA